MSQETYLIAKIVLKRIKSSSSEALPVEFLSPSALTACSRAANALHRLNISTEEKDIISSNKTIEEVEEFITQYAAEVEKRQRNTKAWQKVYAFTNFVGPVLAVFKEANFTPECSLALGLLGMLVIQPLNNKSEIEERLATETQQLQEILAQVSFSKGNVKTMEMEAEIQGLCGAIIDFLLQALRYQKKSSILKVLNSIVADFARRFQTFVTKIKAHATKIEVLAQRRYTTTLLDMNETLDKTVQTIQDLQSHALAQAAKFDLRVSGLEYSIERCQESIQNSSKFSAILYVQQLCAILLPNPPSHEHDALLIRQQQAQLAPRERWEANISEIQAPGWIVKSPRPILWFGGRKNRRNVSWVSGFALDLVDAMEMERSVQAVHTLCIRGQEGTLASPLSIFKGAVVQLLTAYPEIVLIPENLNNLSLQRFQAIGESPEAAFKLLSDVLRIVNGKCQRDGIELFWVIDRVDGVLTKEGLQGRQRFMKALMQLAEEYRRLRILLTSHVSVDEVQLGGGDLLTEIWVDTSKPLAMSSRQ